MTVGELIAELQKADPGATVRLTVQNPKDSASTKDVSVEGPDGDREVTLSGWVASDDEDAWFPEG